VGVLCGYVIGLCVHREVVFRTVEGWWVEERVPWLTPVWSRPWESE